MSNDLGCCKVNDSGEPCTSVQIWSSLLISLRLSALDIHSVIASASTEPQYQVEGTPIRDIG